MKCPRCGYEKARYKQPAGYKSKPKKKDWERTNHTAKCSKCGYQFNAQTGEEIKEESK